MHTPFVEYILQSIIFSFSNLVAWSLSCRQCVIRASQPVFPFWNFVLKFYFVAFPSSSNETCLKSLVNRMRTTLVHCVFYHLGPFLDIWYNVKRILSFILTINVITSSAFSKPQVLLFLYSFLNSSVHHTFLLSCSHVD